MLGASAPPLDPATAPGSHGVLHLLQNQPELTVVGTAVYAAIRKFFVLNSPTVTNQRVPTVPVLGRNGVSLNQWIAVAVAEKERG